MTPNPTREEIDAIEREIREQESQRKRHVKRTVNPRQ